MRGELEISEVNNHDIKSGAMHYVILNGWRTDAGLISSGNEWVNQEGQY